jgi:hypothetical protein
MQNRSRIFGALAIPAGFAAAWYNWHLAQTEGQFYIKLCIFAPLAVFGGILMMVRPDLAGRLRSDSPTSHKAALGVVIGLVAVFSGINLYALKNVGAGPAPKLSKVPALVLPPDTRAQFLPVSANVSTPVSAPASGPVPTIEFRSQPYQLGSYNQKHNPMWEFVSNGETVDNWTTLLTVIERPDARTRQDLDGVSEGILTNYKSKGGQIVMAKTLVDKSGNPQNYLVAAFEEPARHAFELNFVNAVLGKTDVVVVIYGVRVTDPRDPLAKAKEFLSRNSGPIGMALGEMPLPDVSQFPRREF